LSQVIVMNHVPWYNSNGVHRGTLSKIPPLHYSYKHHRFHGTIAA
jgi:hypothetical protein